MAPGAAYAVLVKICFFTSGLEPGRDGVGDHVRMLADEISSRGHQIRIIALNDRHCTEFLQSERELRLCESASWGTRERAAKEFLHKFRPDWISLHFVPFGFHQRGVPVLWPRRFQRLAGDCRTHIMFHELWIGLSKNAPLRQKAIGLLQRKTIERIHRRLRPSFVSTSNSAYGALLKASNIESSVSAMFGNVPINNEPSSYSSLPENEAGVLNVIVFGSLHPEWPAEPLLSYLRDGARKLQRKLTLISIGNLGPGEALWNSLASRYPDVSFVRLGSRSVQEISCCLQRCHFGIATTPLELIGKSGSVAAMIEHGLPVIVNRLERQIPPIAQSAAVNDPQIVISNERLPEIIVTLPRWPKVSRLKSSVDRLLSEMAARS